MIDKIAIGEHTFSVSIESDDYQSAPWEQCDGHGPVSEWRTRDWRGHYPKKPGEIKLCSDRGSARFYDFTEAMKLAKRDGWGTEGDEGLTCGQKALKAVQADFDYLCRWCDGQWWYVGVVVTHDKTGEQDSIWGIESDCSDYVDEVARECVANILHSLGVKTAIAKHTAKKTRFAYGETVATYNYGAIQ